VLVLLEALTNETSDLPPEIFKKAYKTIKEHYLQYLRESNEKHFTTKDVLPFFTTLAPPLGFVI